MRIKSNLGNNSCVSLKGGKSILIPAMGMLELEDSMYLEVAGLLAPAIEAGELTIVKSVALTPEQEAEEEAKKVKAAKDFLAKVQAKGK